MFYKNEPSKVFLTYGSIISFILDKAQTNTSPIFNNNEENLENGKIISNNEESQKEEDIFLNSEFLYSQGVFNEYSFFYKFRDITDLKYNYYNSLFLVLPKGDFDSLTKLRALKRQLKNAYPNYEFGEIKVNNNSRYYDEHTKSWVPPYKYTILIYYKKK